MVHVMARCLQAAGHYLSQCLPRSISLYATRPQWVKDDNMNIWVIQVTLRNSLWVPEYDKQSRLNNTNIVMNYLDGDLLLDPHQVTISKSDSGLLRLLCFFFTYLSEIWVQMRNFKLTLYMLNCHGQHKNISIMCITPWHWHDIVEILPHVRQELTYSTWSVSWVLMSWRCKEPGHQQPWYLLCWTGKFGPSMLRVKRQICKHSLQKMLVVFSGPHVLTHRGRHKMADILQPIYWMAFSSI